MGGPTAEQLLYAPFMRRCLVGRRAQYASSQTRCEMTGGKSRTSIFRHRKGRLSMISIDGYWRIAAAALVLATGGSAMAGSLGGPLELQDEGSFFVNGQLTQSTHPGTAVGGISQPRPITGNPKYVPKPIPKTLGRP